MSLFLSSHEREFIHSTKDDGVCARLYWSTLNRVMRRSETPGLANRTDAVDWWLNVEEVLCEAALMQALQPSAQLGGWLRDATMSVVRRSESDWVGPWFRDHSKNPPHAELETAHVTRAVVTVLDLVPEIFSVDEYKESLDTLRQRAVPMALRHLDEHRELHNHRCIVASGLAAAAVLLNDRGSMNVASREYRLYSQGFQPDGTYGETLQYANYAIWSMMWAYEALVRRDPEFANSLRPKAYAGYARWAAYSFLYLKPLADWGQEDRPRSLNFGDSAAIFAPSAETLLHIASRCRDTAPLDASLARWLFDETSNRAPSPPPFDLATFGMLPRPGFLTMPLLANACEGRSPGDLKLPLLAGFSCGDAVARDNWNGRTVLGVRGAGDLQNAVSHLHGDLNSGILVHNRERLLVDPGHSCYRSLLHSAEIATATHSTCTFFDPASAESQRPLQQTTPRNRKIVDETTLGPAVDRGALKLLTAQDGPVCAIASDAAALYSPIITQFARAWVLCGTHVLFVIDVIKSSIPVQTQWNWLLNNRDGRLDLQVKKPDHLIVRRGDAGMKLFHLGNCHVSGPTYGVVHDAYNPAPSQRGEGRIGSGWIMHWRESTAVQQRTVVHAIALDDAGRIESWSLKRESNDTTLGNGRSVQWTLGTPSDAATFTLKDVASGKQWTLGPVANGPWTLKSS